MKGSIRWRLFLNVGILLVCISALVAFSLFVRLRLDKDTKKLEALLAAESAANRLHIRILESNGDLEKVLFIDQESSMAQVLARNEDIGFLFESFRRSAVESGYRLDQDFADEIQSEIFEIRNDFYRCAALVRTGRKEEARRYFKRDLAIRLKHIEDFVNRSADLRIQNMQRRRLEIAKSRTRLLRMEILAVLLIGFVGMGMSFGVARSILEPLARLTRKAQGLSGEGSTTPSAVSADEAHVLEMVFDQMVANLRGQADELQNALDAVKANEERLKRSNRELQDFASIASHDLQEPLRKVQVFGDRINTKYGSLMDEQGRDYMDRMLKAVARMQVFINDLLSYSRVTTKAQPFTPVDLQKTAAEVVSDLEVRMEQAGGRVDVGALPTVMADPLQMRQLLQNLIGNALKFHKKDAPPRIRLFMEKGPSQCRIVVEDNGIGFDPKYAERIFGVFERLHGRDEYEGTGMGLAICRKIVDRHGGTIVAQSASGQGASFIITFPESRMS